MSTTFRFENLAKENQDVFLTRKPGVSSARKPLGDRSVNKNIGNTNVVQSAKKMNVTGAKPKIKEFPEWYYDVCSYDLNRVEDDYSLWGPQVTISRAEIRKMLCPPTPPPSKEIQMRPEVYEIPCENRFEDSCALQEKIIDDIDFPPFFVF